MRVLSRLTMVVLSGLLLADCDAGPATTGGPELPPAVGRPDGASQGPRAAVIVAVRGAAEVQPSQGLAFSARPELQLLRDDRIVTGPDSLVVVALHNQHVVRLNPGTLRVDAIAMFDERAAGDDLQQRFEQLLTPDERQDPELRGAIARVAGWNTRMTAAETIAPQSASDRDRERPDPPPPPAEEDGKRASPTDPVDAPSTDVAENLKVEPKTGAPAADSKAPSKKKASTSDDADDGQLGGDGLKNPFPRTPPEPESEADPTSSSRPPTGKTPEDERAPGLPDQVVFRPDDGSKQLRVSLPAPLVAVRASLAACAGAGVKIRVHVVGKKISELKVNGVAGECEPGLLGKSVGLADGWIELQVQ